MTFLIDPPAVEVLITRMRRAADDAESAAGRVASIRDRLGQREVEMTALAAVLRLQAADYDRVAVLLGAAIALVEDAEITAADLAAATGLSRAEAAAILEALAAEGITDPADVLAILIVLGPEPTPAAIEALLNPPPETLREVFVGLPPPGVDPRLDLAIKRLDRDLLDKIADGEPIDTDDLTDEQKRDLRILAAALGGDEITVTRTRTERYEANQGDDHTREVPYEVPITDLPIESVLVFVEANASFGQEFRYGVSMVNRMTGGNPADADVAEVAAQLGVSNAEARAMIDVATELAARPGDRGIDGDDGGSDRDDQNFRDLIDNPLDDIEDDADDTRQDIEDAIERAKELKEQYQRELDAIQNPGGTPGEDGEDREGSGGITDAEREEFGGPAEDYENSNGLL